MAVNPPPIQEKPVDEASPFKLFPQTWIRWFQTITDKINELEELVGLSSVTSFGETVVAQNEAFVHGSAIYNFLPTNFRSFTSGTGTSTVADRLFKVTTGTTSGGYGAIQSFRAVNAKIGQSTMTRFSGYFESNVANSWQGIGLVNLGDELSFGYSGTDFGIWHRYGGLAEVRTITVSGAAGGAENLTLTLNSVAYTIPLTAGTTAHNAYEIADWLNDEGNQTVWKADQLGSTVIISAQSDGAKSGTYSFSSSTATGSIAQDTAGVTKTSTHIPQSDWNGNSLSAALDPSKGNVYQIIYQNMGFGEAIFYVEDQNTSGFVKVHTLRVNNTTTTSTLSNPSLRCGMYCVSLGSTTDLAVYADGFSSFVQGKPQKTRNPRSRSATQTLSTTNETNVLTIRNRRTYNGYANQVEIEPLRLTVSSEVNKNVIFRVRATADPGVEQNFANVGNNLVSDYDTTSVAVSAGTLLDSVTVAPSSGDKINLKELEIRLPPTLHAIITAQRTGGASGDVTATFTWYEDV